MIDAYAPTGTIGHRSSSPGRYGRPPALQRRARAAGVADSIRWAGFQRARACRPLPRAIAYVDPSLYEGFGLQAAEALACGTPVIASNTTSLPEVVGDAGILLDPHDVAGFAEAMRRVADDGTLAADLQAKALARACRFTWEHTARELLKACARGGAMSSLDRCGAVVVAHARLDLARECVRSLAQWLPPERIVVVLNRPGSDPDNAAALVGARRRWSRLRAAQDTAPTSTSA